MSHDNNNRAEFVYIFSTNENKVALVLIGVEIFYCDNTPTPNYGSKVIS